MMEEQKFTLGGLVRESDLIEAGALAGAEGLLTLQTMCLGGSNILKAKLISVSSGLVLWSAIASNSTVTPNPREISDRVLEEL